MNQFFVSATGRLLDMGGRIAAWLSDVVDDERAVELVRSLAQARRELPASLGDRLGDDLDEARLREFLRVVDEQSGDLEAALTSYLTPIDSLPDEGVVAFS